MPGEQCFKTDESRDVLKDSATQTLRSFRQPSPLIIGKANPFGIQQLTKYAIFFPPVLYYRVLLLLIRPARNGGCEETKGIER
jgi:hypothetical protein